MRTVFAGYASPRRAGRIALSGTGIDETAPQGTLVGALSAAGGSWTFRLADSAGGMFALDGNGIVTGPTPLSHAAAPAPAILVAASDGARTAASLITVNVRKALPALPLPLGARVAVHGDSQTGFNNAQGPSGAAPADAAVASFSYGAVEQLLSENPRFNFDSWFDPADPWKRNIAGANQGLFGDHMEWDRADWGFGIAPRMAATLARNCQIVILQGGTNSLNSGDTTGSAIPSKAHYVIAKLETCLRLCRNKGRWVILETLLPRADWPANDPRYGALAEVNAWIRAQAGRPGILGIWDSWDVLAPGGTLDPAMFLEGVPGVHRNQRGAHASALLGAQSLKSIIDGAISAGSVFDQDPTVSNLFGASTGNLAGTAGSKIGVATTGQVATGCTLRMIRGASTQVASKETVSGSLTRQAITITPVSDGVSGGYHQSDFTLPTITTGLPAAGGWARAWLLVEIGNTQSISHVMVTVKVQDGATDRVVARALSGNSTSYRVAAPGNRSFWAATKPFQMPSGASFDRIAMTASIFFPMAAPDAPTVKLSRPILRSIADPRPAWGYP